MILDISCQVKIWVPIVTVEYHRLQIESSKLHFLRSLTLLTLVETRKREVQLLDQANIDSELVRQTLRKGFNCP